MAKLKSRPQMRGRGVSETNPPPPYRGDEGGESEQPHDFQLARLGLYIFLGALTMMFGALALLYLLRTPMQEAFAFQLPRLSWLSTAVILLSSIPCQMALNAARAGSVVSVARGTALTFGLGLLFLAMQAGSWSEVAQQLQGAPVHFFSAMFYVISAVHGLHLLGGLVFMGYLLYQAFALRIVNPQVVELGAIYWHFLGVLWAALFAVMLVK
ncbi:MAG: cytochrome c oxidase subunit 3 [Fimbriimonadales bacterium]|nr:cytochrome c oxidase subunit 3 [Fimbriimonadales bacterium]MDW8051051.1 cytochrome c oxidase subunit 3 [Armatimonadota bacterium]